MATSQDNMFQESLVKFSYDREKEIKVQKTLKVVQSSKTSIQISSLKQLILIILKKKTLSESEYTRFEDKFIFMAKQFLSY